MFCGVILGLGFFHPSVPYMYVTVAKSKSLGIDSLLNPLSGQVGIHSPALFGSELHIKSFDLFHTCPIPIAWINSWPEVAETFSAERSKTSWLKHTWELIGRMS